MRGLRIHNRDLREKITYATRRGRADQERLQGGHERIHRGRGIRKLVPAGARRAYPAGAQQRGEVPHCRHDRPPPPAASSTGRCRGDGIELRQCRTTATRSPREKINSARWKYFDFSPRSVAQYVRWRILRRPRYRDHRGDRHHRDGKLTPLHVGREQPWSSSTAPGSDPRGQLTTIPTGTEGLHDVYEPALSQSVQRSMISSLPVDRIPLPHVRGEESRPSSKPIIPTGHRVQGAGRGQQGDLKAHSHFSARYCTVKKGDLPGTSSRFSRRGNVRATRRCVWPAGFGFRGPETDVHRR